MPAVRGSNRRMDAPSHDTIDALLAELVPTTRLDDHPGADPDRDGAQPGHRPPGVGRPRRWPLRLALPLAAIGLAAALFAAGVVVGRQTAGGESVEGADATGLGSTQVEPFGTASLNSEAGDAAQTDPTGLVARYRDELAARDLVSTSLGDDDLTRFGYAACVFAASAEGPADFERFRTAAVADADSSLSDADMALVIDTAVVVFCPVDAERLGITA
jgi:hypothetical protein